MVLFRISRAGAAAAAYLDFIPRVAPPVSGAHVVRATRQQHLSGICEHLSGICEQMAVGVDASELDTGIADAYCAV